MATWDEWLSARREDLIEGDLLRRLVSLRPEDGLRAELDGRPVVLFSSNDYLGLSSHPRVREAAAEAARRCGLGPRGSALICGHTDEHEALERELAGLTGKEAAVLFPTGYAANLSVITALAGPDTAVFSDERNHASIIDGCRAARRNGAAVHVYRHADPDDLAARLGADASPRRLVVTDTVFSMDGDPAPLAEIAEVAERHGALLAVDEAHAMLVFGEGGGGVSEARGVSGAVDVHVGTLGKAFGAHGGFVASSARIVEHVVNFGRPFVYSTALPVPVVAAARASLGVFRSEPGLRERLFSHVRAVGRALGVEPASPIVKVECGDERSALEASRGLLTRGLYVPAVRPPTVPPGAAGLRLTLSAGHAEEEVARLADALRLAGLGRGVHGPEGRG